MKKEWRKPQLNELNVKQTKADASGRPIPVSYPGVITCHEPVSGHGDEYGYDEWHVHADVPFLSVCQKLNAVSFVWIVEN